jgi:hypothetical protein
MPIRASRIGLILSVAVTLTVPATGALASDVTITRGFGGATYFVKASKAPHSMPSSTHPCALTFAEGDKPNPSLFETAASRSTGCRPGVLVGTDKGLQIRLAIEQPQSFVVGAGATDVDASSWGADYLSMAVCRTRCQRPSRLPPSKRDAWALLLVLDRNDHVFAIRNGAPIKGVASEYSQDDTPCALTKRDAAPPNRWCRSITVPWSAFDLSYNDQPTTLNVDAVLITHGRPVEVGSASITVIQSSTGDENDHRNAYFTQYDQYAAQTQTPPPTGAVRFVPGPPSETTVTLAKPYIAPSTMRFPPLNADVNAPLNQNLSLSATFNQNNAFVQGLQKAIKTGIGDFPEKTGPKYPCESCTTFQTQNSDILDLPKASTNISLLAKSLGIDDIPVQVETLPDLYAGGALYGSNDDGSTKAGVLHANPTKGFSQRSSTDTEIAVLRGSGFATIAAQAAFIEHALSPGAQRPTVGKLTTISLPQVNTYSLFFADSNQKSNSAQRSSSNFVSVLRYSYDASDRALNAFGGFQAARTAYTPAGNALKVTGFVGYRGLGRNYHTLDGVQPAYPAVSGPLAAVDIAIQPPGLPAPTFDLSGYGATYTSPTDHYSVRSAKVQIRVYKSISAYYEATESRLSAALAAVSQLGNQLGDAPYQTARTAIVAQTLSETFTARDQTVGLALKSDERSALKAGLIVGYDFDHVAPSCKTAMAPTMNVIECERALRRTRTLTSVMNVSLPNLTFAASYKPTFYQGARSTVEAERVYNVALAYQYLKCTSVILSASNDAGTLGFFPDGTISSTFAAEMNTQLPWPIQHGLLPTLVLGFSNNIGAETVNYVGTDPFNGMPATVPIPFRTRSVSFYTALRIGNKSFRASTMPKCLPKSEDSGSSPGMGARSSPDGTKQGA